MTWLVVAAAVVVIAVVLGMIALRRRGPDGVTTFQRQIDALSPDARRSVVRSVEDLKRQKSKPHVDVEAEAPGRRGVPRRGVVGDPLGGDADDQGSRGVSDGA